MIQEGPNIKRQTEGVTNAAALSVCVNPQFLIYNSVTETYKVWSLNTSLSQFWLWNTIASVR